MKNYSVFQKVLLNNFKVMLVPLILVMVFVGTGICVMQQKAVFEAEEDNLQEYISDLTARLSGAIKKSENIGRYDYLTSNLNKKFRNQSQAFEFSTTMSGYLDSLVNPLDGEELTIYFRNNTIFENRYFKRIEQLKNYDELLKKQEASPTEIFCNEKLLFDETKGTYITFNKFIMFSNDAIIEFRVYIISLPPSIIITEKNNEPMKGYLTKEINSYFDAHTKIDYKEIYTKWFQTWSIILLFLTVLIFIPYQIAKKTTNAATKNIRVFIDSLNPEEIIKTGVKFDIGVREWDEVQVIKKTILALLDKVNETSNLHHQVELEKEKIRFELLQSQINPHFMYNALSALRLSASMNHDNDMVLFVDNLVSYFRLVLNKGKTMVTLEEELLMIRKYVKIIELSNLNEYDLTITCDEAIKKVEVLHLLLQPFVENALGHGLSGIKRKQYKIDIICCQKDEFLVVRIADNGRGIKPETLDMLNDLEKSDIGYGIKNTYTRLRMTYGDSSCIHFESAEDAGTEVEIKFPILGVNDHVL